MSTLSEDLERQKRVLQNAIEHTLEKIGQEIILPALRSNYEKSSLKTRTGKLLNAMTQRSASGNIFAIEGNTLTVGVDTSIIPYAKFLLETGSKRHSITPRTAKCLYFYWEKMGGYVALKYVNHPGHAVYNLYEVGPDTIEKANELIRETFGSGAEISLT